VTPMVWAIDFHFDSTVDGKAIKIASMIDEHTRGYWQLSNKCRRNLLLDSRCAIWGRSVTVTNERPSGLTQAQPVALKVSSSAKT